MSAREELEARLRKANSQLAELERAREERAEDARFEQEVIARERAVKDEHAIAEAEEKYGPVGTKIAIVQTELGAIVLKRPNALHFRRFQDEGETKSKHVLQLVRPCRVYPDEAAFEQILEEQPAVLVALGNAVSELAGARTREVSGK